MSEITIKLKAPEGATSLSVDGREFKVDKKGFVQVPDGMQVRAFEHGFTAVDDAAPAAESNAEA